MKELLKRELNKTYLILSSEDENYEESYEIEMILRNSLSTLLSFHVFRIDGILEINYDISAKQNLKSCAERVKLSADTIRSLFSSIGLLFQEMKEYLLDAECILWDLEHIYTKEGQFFFCYCPWKKQDLVVSFRSMLEEMLGVLDYYDHEGVALSYHMYQSACKGDFDIEEILKEHMPKEKEPPAVYEEPMFLDTEEFMKWKMDTIIDHFPVYEKLQKDENYVYSWIEDYTEFPGGNKGLVNFIKENVRMGEVPADLYDFSRVSIGMIIDKDGSILYPEILDSDWREFDAEAMRLVQMMPKWKPGSIDGVKVKNRVMVEINYKDLDRSHILFNPSVWE